MSLDIHKVTLVDKVAAFMKRLRYLAANWSLTGSLMSTLTHLSSASVAVCDNFIFPDPRLPLALHQLINWIMNIVSLTNLNWMLSFTAVTVTVSPNWDRSRTILCSSIDGI